jgi:hypothetical protein
MFVSIFGEKETPALLFFEFFLCESWRRVAQCSLILRSLRNLLVPGTLGLHEHLPFLPVPSAKMRRLLMPAVATATTTVPVSGISQPTPSQYFLGTADLWM